MNLETERAPIIINISSLPPSSSTLLAYFTCPRGVFLARTMAQGWLEVERMLANGNSADMICATTTFVPPDNHSTTLADTSLPFGTETFWSN